jgi:MFS family permease
VGVPGLLWVILLFTVREPVRRQAQPALEATDEETGAPMARTTGGDLVPQLAPIFAAVALASFVDNAVAAWSPSLLIREFHRQAADVGVTLGGVFMVAGAFGVLAGGVGADRAAQAAGWSAKVRLCMIAAVVNLPCLALLASRNVDLVLAAVATDFVMSGVVTAAGLSAILDLVPNRRRGVATSISFFLNVAIGVGVGPTAVALAEGGVFGPRQGLGPPLLLVTGSAYVVVVAALWFALRRYRRAASG